MSSYRDNLLNLRYKIYGLKIICIVATKIFSLKLYSNRFNLPSLNDDITYIVISNDLFYRLICKFNDDDET